MSVNSCAMAMEDDLHPIWAATSGRVDVKCCREGCPWPDSHPRQEHADTEWTRYVLIVRGMWHAKSGLPPSSLLRSDRTHHKDHELQGCTASPTPPHLAVGTSPHNRASLHATTHSPALQSMPALGWRVLSATGALGCAVINIAHPSHTKTSTHIYRASPLTASTLSQVVLPEFEQTITRQPCDCQVTSDSRDYFIRHLLIIILKLLQV